MSLKEEFLKLLESDKEFRYAVAGLLGLEEILKRLDRHEEELIKLRKDMNMGFRRHDEELAKLREDMNKLREDMINGFRRHDEELAKLREDMIAGFKRYDEEIAKLREDMNAGFRRYDEEITKLRKDMNRGFMLVERHISALGARWGIMSEEAFREGLRGLLEDELGLRVERWSCFDEDGRVFGYPSLIEVDVAVHDGKVVLVEVKSHVRASDVAVFKKKCDLYREKTGETPARRLIITPYAEKEAFEAAKALNVEIYTKV